MELLEVNQDPPQHLVYVRGENLRRDFLAAQLESMHRSRLEDLVINERAISLK